MPFRRPLKLSLVVAMLSHAYFYIYFMIYNLVVFSDLSQIV